jgi:hypothetical protein
MRFVFRFVFRHSVTAAARAGIAGAQLQREARPPQPVVRYQGAKAHTPDDYEKRTDTEKNVTDASVEAIEWHLHPP